MPIIAVSEQEITNLGILSVRGEGLLSCGNFISYLDADNVTAEAQFTSWIDGFISGINYQDTIKKMRGANIDTEATKQLLVNYCRENPLDMFFTAAIKLAKELENR
jgi:hypothetical protein